MKKIFYRLLIVILLAFGTISNTLISINFLSVKSANLLEPIQDKEYSINGIHCESDIYNMYLNNNFLFIGKLDYVNYTLEIYDVSNPQNLTLLKTYNYQNWGCYFGRIQNCLAGNENYTFLRQLDPITYEKSIIAFNINSTELISEKMILADSNYSINQIMVDNEYLYLVRDHYNWTLDWQLEKYKINNPLSLSLVSNVTISKDSYIYVKENNLFIFNNGDINNWSISYGSDDVLIKDAYFENDKLYILLKDNYYSQNYFTGLLILDVINENNFQVLTSYSFDYGETSPSRYGIYFYVVDNKVIVVYPRDISEFEIIDNNLVKISNYSFEHIYGEIMLTCYDNNLLYISKLSCCCRDLGTKDEDRATLVILDLENPSKIEAVYPRGFDNGFQLFYDGGFFAIVLLRPIIVLAGITLVSLSITLIVKRIKKKNS